MTFMSKLFFLLIDEDADVGDKEVNGCQTGYALLFLLIWGKSTAN